MARDVRWITITPLPIFILNFIFSTVALALSAALYAERRRAAAAYAGSTLGGVQRTNIGAFAYMVLLTIVLTALYVPDRLPPALALAAALVHFVLWFLVVGLNTYNLAVALNRQNEAVGDVARAAYGGGGMGQVAERAVARAAEWHQLQGRLGVDVAKVEFGLSLAVWVLWCVLMLVSAVALHRWRRASKALAKPGFRERYEAGRGSWDASFR